jgi:hypothetical protein
MVVNATIAKPEYFFAFIPVILLTQTNTLHDLPSFVLFIPRKDVVY